jgi:hypothetical protein
MAREGIGERGDEGGEHEFFDRLREIVKGPGEDAAQHRVVKDGLAKKG